MRIVLFAYRDVGYFCLKYLLKINLIPELVVVPKKEIYSKDKFKLVSKLAKKHQIKIFFYTPKENCKNRLTKLLSKIGPEYGISTYFPYILDAKIIKLFSEHIVNIHGGILPNYRGTFSSVWSIINNEKYSGSTLHVVDNGIDTGNIIKIKKCRISKNDTGYTLYNKVSIKSLELIKDYIFKIVNGRKINSVKQSPIKVNYYSRKLPHNGKINWNWKSKYIFNFCRALYFPGYKKAVTNFGNLEVEIFDIFISRKKSTKRPGSVAYIGKKTIKISTSDYDVFSKDKKYDSIFKNKENIFLE